MTILAPWFSLLHCESVLEVEWRISSPCVLEKIYNKALRDRSDAKVLLHAADRVRYHPSHELSDDNIDKEVLSTSW